jgi:general secretion pathway protein J
MKQEGFTLIELVVAMMLLGIMMLLLYSGLTFALRGWDSAGAHGQLVADRRLGENFLRREVMETFPMRWTDPFIYKLAFSGESNRLRFVSSRPPASTQGGLSLVAVEWERDPQTRGGRLVMRRAMPDDAANDFSPLDRASERTVLVDDVSAASFSYFGAETDFAEAKWEDNWTYQKLPLLVRLRLTGGDGVPLPDMVLRIALSEEAGCLENAFQRMCRARRAVNP